MKKIGKYEFDNLATAERYIEALGDEHSHTFVNLGYIILENGEYDISGVQTKAPVLSEKYHVDVLWIGLDSEPNGWEQYAVYLDNNGVHSFLGLDYNDYKF